MYYDSNKSISIRIRDRLRDLLEGDGAVRDVYPAPRPIRSLPPDDVSQSDELAVSIAVFGTDRAIPIEGRWGKNNVNPRLVLTVQRHASGGIDGDDPEVAQDHCIAVTDAIVAAILLYQADPTPGEDCRLWDEMRFLPQATQYKLMPNKFWASDTLFQLDSYQSTGGQRNSL